MRGGGGGRLSLACPVVAARTERLPVGPRGAAPCTAAEHRVLQATRRRAVRRMGPRSPAAHALWRQKPAGKGDASTARAHPLRSLLSARRAPGHAAPRAPRVPRAPPSDASAYLVPIGRRQGHGTSRSPLRPCERGQWAGSSLQPVAPVAPLGRTGEAARRRRWSGRGVRQLRLPRSHRPLRRSSQGSGRAATVSAAFHRRALAQERAVPPGAARPRGGAGRRGQNRVRPQPPPPPRSPPPPRPPRATILGLERQGRWWQGGGAEGDAKA